MLPLMRVILDSKLKVTTWRFIKHNNNENKCPWNASY